MARRVLTAEVLWGTGARETEVKLDGWCEVALGNRGMTVEAARQCAKEWRALVHM